MCGINGFTWKDEKLIDKMNNKISYRGPDDKGIYATENISLGHVRLSVLDLTDAGHQPMFYTKAQGASSEKYNSGLMTKSKISIVFNGEIYNYKEIKKELAKNGYIFSTKTDTEVILAAYLEWGEQCVKRFNGMWSFCIYDKDKKILFCSRDRLGIKPFHYYHNKDKFIFSSEAKAILTHNIATSIDPHAIASFLRYRYVLEENTFFKDIKKLKAGFNLIYDLKKHKILIKQYWDVEQKDSLDSFLESKKSVEDKLKKSIKYRMISDVPIGSLLSGGIDSSLISAMMSQNMPEKLNTYTVKFREKGFDETAYAKMVADALNTNHAELEISNKTYVDSMDEYLKYKDEPIGVPNEVALFLLFRKIKKTATVVLAGEGADEIFMGYGRIFRSPFDFERQLTDNKNINFIDFFMQQYGYFKEEEIKKILNEETYLDFKDIFRSFFEKTPRDLYSKISYIFLKLHLPGLLQRTDSSSMANAIESRVPFLDHNLVEYVYSLHHFHKNKFKDLKSHKESHDLTSSEISENKDIPKYILKIISEAHIPKKVIYRKKQGFPLPLDIWFGKDYITTFEKRLINKKSHIYKYIKINGLKHWIDKNKDKSGFGQKLWMLYSLDIWLAYIKKTYPNVLV